MGIKKKGLWSVLALGLAVLTVWIVIRGSGMPLAEFMEAVQEASPGWLIMAFLCMFGFIFFEGEAVLSIVRNIGHTRPHRKGFVYAAADVYFSAITPSATGGQPASAYFMIRDGIPTAVATAALLVNLICYNAAILTISLVSLALRPEVFLNFRPFGKVLIAGGFLVILGLTFMFYMMLHKRDFLFRQMLRFTAFLHRHHLLKHPEKAIQKVEMVMEEYRQCVEIIAGHRKMWLTAYGFNLLQRISQILVTGCAYKALGGVIRMWKLLVTQSFVVVGSNCIPVPGAMGVADYLMLDGYVGLMERDLAFQVQMLSRSISFYSCILISGLTVILAILIGRRKKGENV